MDANPFHDPQLAEIFDAIGESDRGDLDPWLAIVEELHAHTIIDLGSGTGVLACRLAALGMSVIGIEPGPASMNLARRQTGADRVQWILGDAAAMPVCDADLVMMTGNIPEHMSDSEWTVALAASHRALRPGGHLVFENRDVTQSWLTSPQFAPRSSPGNQNHGSRTESTPSGPIHHWLEITELTPDAFTFRWTFLIERDGTELTWETTFQLRTVDQIRSALEAASFSLIDIRDDHIFIAARPNKAGVSSP